MYLPAGYSKSTNKYPVLYMHDGQNLFESQKTGLKGAGSPVKWNVDEALETLISKKLANPCIIVGIFNTAKRIEEYSPPTNSSWRGLLGNYSRFIVEELKPWIDSNYRTDPSPRTTGVMGSSMGGLASFYLQMWYPEVFGFAGVVSPSFWWGNEQVLSHMNEGNWKNVQLMYIDAGWRESDEMIVPARHVYTKLSSKLGDRLWYYEDRNGTHSEGSWQNRVFIPLLLFTGKEKPTFSSWTPIIDPPVIGINDRSAVTIEVSYENGLKRTFFPSLSSKDMSISKEYILGKAAGPATLTISTPWGTTSTNLTILARSRDDIIIHFKSSKALTMEVFLYVSNNIQTQTNWQISFLKTNEISLIEKRGTRYHFRVLDETGKPLERNGKPMELSVTFTRDRDYVLDF
ncbi:alpha/beta hydrolase [Thermospira aquatica]